MKRKKIVAGNWKMNMTLEESVNLINELKQISTNIGFPSEARKCDFVWDFV